MKKRNNNILAGVAFLVLLVLIFSLVVRLNPRNSVHLKGHVSKGQTFRKDIGHGLVFILTPDENGWYADVVPLGHRNINEYGFASIATPPYHGMNDLQIMGWDFRNAGNTDAGDAGVGAPQKTRQFSFVMDKEQADTIAQAIQKEQDVENLDIEFGSAEMRIDNIKLGNLVPGKQAWIDSMDFSVTLHFPDKPQKSTK
jgi:hypothetical protein